ncbi:ParB family protein [Pseudarthrobacter sp. LMD1-1-1.1]|uniref:ParB family protein n=1 Tax=Pseudarthrobacter sp. LMD1-1-1.1 TaxID=3135242 RepID=UPI0034401C7D
MPISKKTKTVSAYFTEDDTDQIRAAVQAVGKIEGYPSITALVEAATLRELRRLQRKYNGGRKWRGVPAGQMRPGQRTREETQQSQTMLDEQRRGSQGPASDNR